MLDLFKRNFSITRRTSLFFLAVIFLLGVFLRFYDLGNIPNGLQQDETSIGYNAYSILMTGKDEYGVKFPVLFKAFGEYKLPGYIYSAVLPIWFFGPDAFAVRFISALFGCLSILMFYFLLREMTSRKEYILPLVSALFLAINPWHLHFSRGAFEVTLALFFIVTGSYFFFLAKRRKSLLLMLLSLLTASFSMYTYNIARVFTPLLFVSYFYIYRLDRIFLTNKQRAIFVCFTAALIGVFLLQVIADGGYSSTRGTLILSSAEVQSKLLEFRSYLIVLPSLVTKLFFNMFVLTALQYLQNILSYFSVSFLFLTGSSHGNHGIGNVGQMYMIEVLFILVGVISYFRNNERKLIILFIWAALVIVVASMTREAPHATRGFFLTIPLLVFSALGYITLVQYLIFSKHVLLNYGVLSAVMLLFIFNVTYYFVSYYNRFPILYAPQWRSEDQELAAFIRENESKYDRIVIDKKANVLYSSLAYYLQFSPNAFQQTVSRLPDDSEGFSSVKSFGKFVYKDIELEKDSKLPRTLIIMSPKQSVDESLVLRKFDYPMRPVVVAVGQEIMQFPVQDPAYVLIETTP